MLRPGLFTSHGLSFPENYQLTMEVEISVKLQEYASSTYEVAKGAVITSPLKCIDHGLENPSSTGALIFLRVLKHTFKISPTFKMLICCIHRLSIG